MNQDEYLKQRVDNQIEWYSKKSQYNQKMFKRLRIIEIITAAMIPVLAGFVSKFDYLDYTIAFLGLIIVIIAGILSLYRFQEIWTGYRTTSESLKHEKFLYLTKAEPYNTEEDFPLFVQRIENQISKENTNWIGYMKKKDTEKDDGK